MYPYHEKTLMEQWVEDKKIGGVSKIKGKDYRGNPTFQYLINKLPVNHYYCKIKNLEDYVAYDCKNKNCHAKICVGKKGENKNKIRLSSVDVNCKEIKKVHYHTCENVGYYWDGKGNLFFIRNCNQYFPDKMEDEPQPPNQIPIPIPPTNIQMHTNQLTVIVFSVDDPYVLVGNPSAIRRFRVVMSSFWPLYINECYIQFNCNEYPETRYESGNGIWAILSGKLNDNKFGLVVISSVPCSTVVTNAQVYFIITNIPDAIHNTRDEASIHYVNVKKSNSFSVTQQTGGKKKKKENVSSESKKFDPAYEEPLQPFDVEMSETYSNVCQNFVKGEDKDLAEMIRKYPKLIKNVRNGLGMNPLMYYSYAGNKDIVEFMLKNGYDPNFRDNLGNSSFFLAFRMKKLDVCKTLLEYDADLLIKNKYGQNYFEAAIFDVSIEEKVVYEKLNVEYVKHDAELILKEKYKDLENVKKKIYFNKFFFPPLNEKQKRVFAGHITPKWERDSRRKEPFLLYYPQLRWLLNAKEDERKEIITILLNIFVKILDTEKEYSDGLKKKIVEYLDSEKIETDFDVSELLYIFEMFVKWVNLDDAIVLKRLKKNFEHLSIYDSNFAITLNVHVKDFLNMLGFKEPVLIEVGKYLDEYIQFILKNKVAEKMKAYMKKEEGFGPFHIFIQEDGWIFFVFPKLKIEFSTYGGYLFRQNKFEFLTDQSYKLKNQSVVKIFNASEDTGFMCEKMVKYKKGYVKKYIFPYVEGTLIRGCSINSNNSVVKFRRIMQKNKSINTEEILGIVSNKREIWNLLKIHFTDKSWEDKSLVFKK